MTEITVFDDGPFLVKGEITLKDAQGNTYNLEGKDTVALCRCGSSANKPYCDGAHTEGFESKCEAS